MGNKNIFIIILWFPDKKFFVIESIELEKLLIYIYFFQVGTILPNRGNVYIKTGKILSKINNSEPCDKIRGRSHLILFTKMPSTKASNENKWSLNEHNKFLTIKHNCKFKCASNAFWIHLWNIISRFISFERYFLGFVFHQPVFYYHEHNISKYYRKLIYIAILWKM